MTARIDMKLKVPDTRAEVKRRYFESLGFTKKIKTVDIVDSYVIDSDLRAAQVKSALPLFENPLVEQAGVNQPQSPKKFDWAIEIGYLPGVTDNVGATAKEMIEDFTKQRFRDGQHVYTSQVIFLSGKLLREDVKTIAGSLYNPLIQRAEIRSFAEFKRGKGMGVRVPKVKFPSAKSADSVNLAVSDDALARIGKEGIENSDGSRRGPLALDLENMKVIRDHFRKLGRKPTDVELESLAQTWSEHCKHAIFADPIDEVKDGLFKTYIRGATEKIRAQKGKKDFCMSVFSDNSGAIVFDDKYLITHKVETHNAPSALDPFGGALTGIVGVNRDALGFGMGAKPVANLYGFCVADPTDATALYRDAGKKGKMLSARRLVEGVVQGVNVGGNCSGIPTPQGFVYFDPRYRGRPLVFAGTVGLIPRKVAGKPAHKKQARPGDYIVMIGGRVGQDGIHGATFSSEVMDPRSPATAVQIGDPITQKKLSDVIVKEARDKGLYHSITDDGAGGLSCSVAEMARESNGCLVDLEKVPLKYPGLAPWQIWISESQERMTLAVPKSKWPAFQKLLASRGVESTVIGTFTDSGKCVVKYKGKKVMDLELDFLHEGRARKHLFTEEPLFHAVGNSAVIARSTFTSFSVNSATKQSRKNMRLPRSLQSLAMTKKIKALLADPNITSFEFISRQYDHEVQAGSVLKPLQGKGRINADATAVRPVLSSKRGIVLSSGINPSYSELDPYRMAACAIDTAIRAAVAAGADPDYLAILDNFCWCSSNEPERLWQLKEAVRACHDYAVAYGTPFISGKDSMFNDFKGFDENGDPIKISIPPTLLISAIGVVSDAEKIVSLDLKSAGDALYVMGNTYDEMAGSEYITTLNQTYTDKLEYVSISSVPRVNAEKNLEVYWKFYRAVQKGLVASAISVSRGGLAIALAKTAMAGKLGAVISLKKLPGEFSNDAAALFSESQGRILASVSKKHAAKFEQLMKGTSFAKIGSVTKEEKIVIRGEKQKINLPIADALKAYRATFANY